MTLLQMDPTQSLISQQFIVKQGNPLNHSDKSARDKCFFQGVLFYFNEPIISDIIAYLDN